MIFVGAQVTRQRMADLGLTYAAMADQGFSSSMLNGIFKEEANPTVSTLEALAEILQIPVTAFWRLEDTPTAPPTLEETLAEARTHLRRASNTMDALLERNG